MAYFYNSNYPQCLENNYQYYDHDQYYYYYSNHDANQEPRYVQYSDTEFYGNAYQHSPTPSLVGYYYSTTNNKPDHEFLTSKNPNFHESGEYYYDPVSIEYVVSYNSVAPEEATDVVKEEEEDNHDPKPFHGGYDIHEKYGKPLPPSEEICHPPSKIDPNVPSLGDFSYGSVPPPYVKQDKKLVSEAGDETKQTANNNNSKVIQEENPPDFKEDEEEEDDDDGYDDEYDEDDDEYYDEDDASEEDRGGEKQDDSSKEPSKNGPIVPLVGVVPVKEVQNLEGEAKPKNGSIGSEVIQEEKPMGLKMGEEGEGKLDQAKPMNGNIVGEMIQKEKDLGLKKDDEEEQPKNENIANEIIQEEKALNLKEEEEEEEEEDLGDEERKEGNYGDQVRRQIPPGYGIEAFDICEGLFGGYFPCLWKRNQRIYNHQRDVNNHEKMSDYDYCWKETADYLFGNPNPYGGSMPEKGSYGDPVYCYQRHYPQQPFTEQVEGNSSWLHSSRHYYGHNVGQYQGY